MCGAELTIASAQPFPYKMPPTGRVALIMIDWQRDLQEFGAFAKPHFGGLVGDLTCKGGLCN